MTNLLSLFLSSASQGVLWALLAIGVYITFRILDIADLTAEGSFPLGAGIAAVSITNGYHPLTACLLGFLGGAAAGLVSGLLHTKLKIPALLADHHHDWFILCHIPCDGCAEHLFIGSANDLSLGRVIRHNKRQRCTDRRSAFCFDRCMFTCFVLTYRNRSCHSCNWR
mgnify:CR=1 FL=1